MGKYLDKANKTINKVETVGSKYSYTPPVASKVTPKATPKATTPKKEVKTPTLLGPFARGIPGGRAATPTPKAKTDTPPVKQRTLPQSSPPSSKPREKYTLKPMGIASLDLPVKGVGEINLGTTRSNFAAGAGSANAFMGGTLDYIGQKLGAESVSNKGKEMIKEGEATFKKYNVPYTKDYSWKSWVDPEFYQTTIAQSSPLMGALLLSSGVGALGGGAIAGAAGLGAFGTAVLTAVGAGTFGGVAEALGEAGSAFEASINRGDPVEEADNNADYVFKANAILKMKDPLEWLLALTPVGKVGGKLAKVATKAGKAGTVAKVAGKGAIIAGMEGGEEVLQEKFQANALGDPFTWDTPENRETFAVGAFYGLMMTGMGTAMNHIKAKTISTMDTAERSRFDNAVGNLESAGLDRGSATDAVIDEYAKTPKGESHIEKVMGDVISQAEASVPLKNLGVGVEQETKEDSNAREDVETPTEAILTRKEHVKNILEESNPDMQEYIRSGYRDAKKAGVVDAITQALEEGKSEMDIAKEIAPKLKSKRPMVDAVAMIKSVDAVNAMADERIIVDSAKRGTKETKEGGKENVSTVQKRNQSTDEARLLGLGELEKRIHSELAGQIPEGTTVYELATNETKDIEAARGIGRIFNHEVIHFNVKSDVTGKVRSHANGFNGAIIGDKIYINSDRTNSAHAVAGHEVTHAILKDKEIAKPFLDALTNLITDEGMKQIDSIVENYKRVGLVVTREEAIEEFAGDFIGEQMTKKEFWDELAKKVPDAVKKAIEVLNKIIKRIRAKVGKNNQAEQYLLDLEVARSLAVEAVALHLNKEAATKANLTQEERGILEGFRKQGTTLSSVIESIDFTMNEIINEHISYIKSSSGKGVEQGNVTFTEDGEFAQKSPRVSRNPKWYQDFYADYGRAPRKGEFREVAIDQLRNGFPDFTMEIPPNEQFIELEGAKNVYQTIEQKLSAGMEQELSEQGNEGDSGDSETVNFQVKGEEEVLTEKSSTGKVVKIGNKVYKPTTNRNGKETMEAENPDVRYQVKPEPWAKDFPKVTYMTNISGLLNEKNGNKELHTAAKIGDIDAAIQLVSRVYKKDKIVALGKKHPRSIVVAPHAEEATGRNALPQVYAKFISNLTGLEIDDDIIQSNRAHRTNKNSRERLFQEVLFDGPVQEGKEYIIVDDVVTQGGTVRRLREYIESNGGKVVDVSALSMGYAKPPQLAITDATERGLINKFGRDKLESILEKTAVAQSIGQLTESEGRAILQSFKSLDEIRAAGVKATQARDFTEGRRISKEKSYQIDDEQEFAGVAEVRYQLRTSPPPKKTITAYKLMRVSNKNPGKLYPLFVDASKETPLGVWLDAEEGPRAEDKKSGTPKVVSKLGPLAFRPGWHLGDVPLATHIGIKGKSGNIEFVNPEHVWCECEVAADVDYQNEANANGLNKAGKVIPVKADLKKIPVNGFYRFKTNPTMTGKWIITGSMKINRVLSDDEVTAILGKQGIKNMPRQGGPIDLRKHGFSDDDINYQLKSDAFKNWFGESKVVDENGMPKPLYSGHSNIELYGDSFDPKKATAGGFYATDDPQIASNYSEQKMGIKEYWENGEQYRIYNPKTKKFNKKIREISLTDEQIQVFNEWWEENYGGTLSQYIKDNSRSDAKLRKYQYLGSSNNLEVFWYVMETMGDTIAYAKPGDDPLYVRQQKNTFEELLDKAGIKWQSYEWMQPGVMKVFLKIENPLDTSKPFPADVMASLERIAKREKRMTDDEWRDAHWTKDYPVYKWIEDIKKMEDTGEETFWATQIPTKARKVLKEFGYDGIKDVGGKMGGAGHEVWIALDSNQVKSAIGNKGTFKETDKRIQFQLKPIEDRDINERSFPLTVEEAPWTSDEAKEEINIDRTIFTKAYYYDVAHNPDTIAEAERLIKEDRSSAMDRAMSDKPDHVGTAISLLLMKEAHDSQDWSTFLDLLEHTSEKGTKLGQDIQVLSLWGRITPEGIVRYAKRVFDKATTPKQDDEIKRLTGQIEEGMDEANKRAVDDVLKLIAPTLDELKRMSAAEKLAKMISGHLKKPSERNMWKEMVKTLYTIAKEEAPLPEKAKLEKMNYMSFIGDALRNRDRYMDVWEKTKYTVTDKYKNDPDAQEKLKAYFDMVINQPYPESYLNKAIDDELKALGVKISDLAKAHYSKANTFKGTFAQRLVEQAGLDKVEAKHLENMIYQRMTEATLKEKEKILSRMFKPREKRKQRELWQKILELSNLGGFQLPQYKQLVAEKLGLPRLSKKLNESLYLQAQIIQTMSDGREKHVAIQQMMQDITNAVPSSVAQKVSTVQTMMQLLNPKTIIRNLVGNSGFGVLENISELVAVPLDLVATSVLDAGKHTKIKTASGPQLKAQWEGLQEGWKLGLEDALLGIDTSNNRTQFDLPKGRTFKTGIFSGLETVLNVALRATDRAFYMAALKSSLASQMEAAKTDVPTEEMLKNAALVGLYRTFQDDNNITKMAVGLKRVMNIAGLDKLGLGKPGEFGLGDIVFKYPKTPSNLLARGLDYSPAGLVISISKLLADTSGDKYLRREILVKGTSRAVTGTTLMVLGWWLATLKLVVGNREDDYDIRAVNKTVGLWDNQINVSGLWRFLLSGFNADAAKMKKGDTLVSYDWFQPQSLNIAMGADIAQNDAQFTGFMGTLMGSIEAATNTLAEQPMVTGLTRLFKGEISQAFTETLKSIPSSFTPTFLNQLTQFLDNQKKEVYDPNWSNVALNLARKKVPGASDLLPNAVDVWGKDMENYQNDTNSFFNVFFNPAFVQKYDPSPEAQLVLDLYERTGEAKIAPRLQKKTIRIDSQDVVLSPAEYTALQKFVGQKTQEKYQEYARSRRTGLPDEIQIKQLYNILNDVGADGRDFVKQMRGLK